MPILRGTGPSLVVITALVLALAACSGNPAAPSPSLTVTGTWWLADRSQGSYVLTQNGATVTGVFRSPLSGSDWPLEGTVTGRSLKFTKHMAYYDGTLTGEVSEDGRTLVGQGVSVRTAESPNAVPEPYTFTLYRE
jgi:hypothetical protein